MIVSSTTGDGDAPDTVLKFLRRLKKKTLASDLLADLSYTLLGDLSMTLATTSWLTFRTRFSETSCDLSMTLATSYWPTSRTRFLLVSYDLSVTLVTSCLTSLICFSVTSYKLSLTSCLASPLCDLSVTYW